MNRTAGSLCAKTLILETSVMPPTSIQHFTSFAPTHRDSVLITRSNVPHPNYIVVTASHG